MPRFYLLFYINSEKQDEAMMLPRLLLFYLADEAVAWSPWTSSIQLKLCLSR